jgi:hypothetical protein
VVGQSVGKLSLRIIPDSTKFREQLRKIIIRAEKTMDVHLGVFADTEVAQAQLKRLHREYDGKRVSFNVNAATAAASTKLKEWHQSQNGRSINYKVYVDTAQARRGILGLLKSKVATVDVRVKGLPELQKARAALSAFAKLSGARLTSNVFSEIAESLGKIDVNVPKISRVAVSLAALASSAISAGASIVTVVGDILKIANVGLLLPAILTAAAVGATALVLALQDAGTQLGAFGPAFGRIKAVVSEDFWAAARKPISNFLTSVLPAVTAGMGRTASAIGTQMGVLASSLQNALGGGVLERMFAVLVDTINIATRAVQPLVDAFVELGVVGSAYLPRLATFIVDIATKFNDWVQRVSASGELNTFIEDGISGLKDLAGAVGGLVGIFRGIDSAATAAGARGLAGLRDALQGAASIVQSPEFQTALTTLIAGAERGMDGIGRAVTAVGSMIGTIAPTLATVFSSAGSTIGTLVSAIADAMTQPAFTGGLTDLFAGIQAGVEALAPSIPGIVSAIGQLGSVVGLAAQYFLPLVAILKDSLEPIFSSLLGVISPLIPLFAGGLTAAVQALSPLFQFLGDVISQNQAGFTQIAAAVIIAVPAFRAVAAVMAIVSTAMTIAKAVQAGYIAASYGAAAASYVTSAAARVGAVAFALQSAAISVVNGTLYASVSAWVAQKVAMLQSTAALVANKVQMIASAVAGRVMAAAAVAQSIAVSALNGTLYASVAAWVAQKAAVVGSAAAWVLSKVQMVASTVALVAYNVASKAAAVGQLLLNAALAANPIGIIIVAILALVAATVYFFTQTELGRTIWQGFMDFLATAWQFIQTVFAAGIAAVVAGWNMFWNGLSATVSAVWGFITGAISAGIEAGRAIIVGVLAFIIGFWQAQWNVISTVVSNVWNFIVSAVTNYINNMRAVILAIIVAVVTVWRSNWNNIQNIVSTVVNAVVGFVTGMVNSVKSGIDNAANIVKGIKDNVVGFFSGAGQWLADAGRAIVKGLADGIRGAIGMARDAIGGVMDAVSNFIPHSPAKEGALSGRGWTTYGGAAIGEGLADGMETRLARVRAAASAMTEAASIRVQPVIASAAMNGAVTRAEQLEIARQSARRPDVTIQGDVGMDPEKIAKEIEMQHRMDEMRTPLDDALIP